jgi:class 3 adenylate cyclase
MWPWRNILQAWLANRDDETARAAFQVAHSELRRWVPEVAERLGLDPAPTAADPDESRFHAAEALAGILARPPVGTGLVVLVEDLHRATPGVRTVLETVAPAVVAAGGLLLATSREGRAVADVVRLPGAVRHDLSPLDPAEAARLAVEASGGTLDDVEAQLVATRAAGNAFFVTELARLAASTGRIGVPASVLEVVQDRLSVLDDDLRRTLAVAAVLGNEPDLVTLAAVCDGDAGVDKAIQVGTSVGLLVDSRGPVRFAHDLTREAVLEGLGDRTRARLHDEVADAIERGATGSDGRDALAHHRLASGRDVDGAAALADLAARRAAERVAMEDVGRWADRALALLERAGAGHRQRQLLRARLLHHRGASRTASGEFVDARADLVASAELAFDAGDSTTAAQPLLAIGSERMRGEAAWEPPLDLLDRAIADVEDPLLVVRLVGRRADLGADAEVRRAGGRRALELAMATGDPDLVVRSVVRILISVPRVVVGDDRAELLELLRRTAPSATPQARWESSAAELLHALTAGDLDGIRPWLRELGQGLVALGLPRQLGFAVTEVMTDVVHGRFDDAVVLSDQHVAGARPGLDQMRVLSVHSFQVGQCRYLQGRLGELGALLEMQLAMTAGTPFERLVHCVRAGAEAWSGRSEAAAQAIAEVRRLGLRDLFEMDFAMGDSAACLLADAVWLTGDAATAIELWPWLDAWRERFVVGGMAPVVTFGRGEHALACIAAALGRTDEARTLAATAADAHQAAGAPPLHARSALLAAVLAEQDGDVDAARLLATRAARAAVDCGMVLVGEWAAAVLARLGAAPVAGAVAPVRPIALVFTDLESSTARARELGDEAWMELLRAHTATVRRLVAAHGGREVKGLGDGFMLAFPSVADAARFALDLQSPAESGPVRICVGIHSGPVVEEGGDLFGHSVNLAARIVGAARPGEVLVSAEAHRLLPEGRWGEARTVELKGVGAAVPVHPLLP